MNNDIIFALSSGAGKSGVAVIRVAGDDLGAVARQILGRDDVAPRHAYFVRLRDGDDLIDECLVTFFKGPHSFTGTDVIEIATHGAPAVIARAFEYLRNRFGARIAVPGEFSRRAFLNNKMDLADVDALAALLNAQTEKQRKFALASITGDSARYNEWRAQMIEIAAYAAAMTDYSDDELPPDIWNTVRARVHDLHAQMNDALKNASAVRAIRGGYNIVLTGPVNAGKSSLFNWIVGASRAIVSDTPGTTRDVIIHTLEIDGYMVNLIDTAGVRDATDEIERIGIEKTREQVDTADLIINVQGAGCAAENMGDNEILVINKSDLNPGRDVPGAIYISAKTGDGMDELMHKIREKMHKMLDAAESDVAVNARTVSHLRDAVDALHAAQCAADCDIFAENVRSAADAVGKILGAISANDVMDAAFSQLCLGK